MPSESMKEMAAQLFKQGKDAKQNNLPPPNKPPRVADPMKPVGSEKPLDDTEATATSAAAHKDQKLGNNENQLTLAPPSNSLSSGKPKPLYKRIKKTALRKIFG
eukprot:GHVP01015549.1.p1 GENE.GHVP01015549.1~~GHVP01015549.1.p1  ORF type:complete len:104 (-),score=18.91 GHVP01015549.1:30-341(-)